MSHVVGKAFQDRRSQLDLPNDRVAAPAKHPSHKTRLVVMVNNQLTRYRVAKQTAAALHRPHLLNILRRQVVLPPEPCAEILGAGRLWVGTTPSAKSRIPLAVVLHAVAA